MANLKWSAYQTAITAITGTDLNSLADAGWVLGPEIDNGTNLYLYGDLELVLSSAVTAGSGSPSVDIYLMPYKTTGAPPNPPGTSAGAVPVSYFRGAIAANASASFTRGVFSGLVLPPGYYRIALQNNLGVALPASGNTCQLHPYYETSV